MWSGVWRLALAKGEMQGRVANGDETGEVDFYEQSTVITAAVTDPPAAPAANTCKSQRSTSMSVCQPGWGSARCSSSCTNTLLAAAHELIAQCPCTEGCPGCVGPVFEGQAVQLETKRLTLDLVAALQ
jgi:hypothetical protein